MRITHQELDSRHAAYVVTDGACQAMVLACRTTGRLRAEAVGGATDGDCSLFATEAVAWLSARLGCQRLRSAA